MSCLPLLLSPVFSYKAGFLLSTRSSMWVCPNPQSGKSPLPGPPADFFLPCQHLDFAFLENLCLFWELVLLILVVQHIPEEQTPQDGPGQQSYITSRNSSCFCASCRALNLIFLKIQSFFVLWPSLQPAVAPSSLVVALVLHWTKQILVSPPRLTCRLLDILHGFFTKKLSMAKIRHPQEDFGRHCWCKGSSERSRAASTCQERGEESIPKNGSCSSLPGRNRELEVAGAEFPIKGWRRSQIF